MKDILEAGLYAPTGMGTQGTMFVVVSNPDVMKQVSALNSKFTDQKGDPLYAAPDAIIVFSDDDRNCLQNGSLAMGNLMNAAYTLGIGSCWINRPYQMFDDPEGRKLADEWGVPASYKGVGICILGYPDCDMPEARPRKDGRVVYVK